MLSNEIVANPIPTKYTDSYRIKILKTNTVCSNADDEGDVHHHRFIIFDANENTRNSPALHSSEGTDRFDRPEKDLSSPDNTDSHEKTS